MTGLYGYGECGYRTLLKWRNVVVFHKFTNLKTDGLCSRCVVIDILKESTSAVGRTEVSTFGTAKN
jgi:hypothetical protein